MRLAITLWMVVVLLTGTAQAQTSVIVQARAAAADGRRAEGLALLEAHLATKPNDLDARLIYGLILSWESRYDDARRELSRVLTEAPAYLDARVALMNVEWWSGHFDAAREYANAILSRDAGNPQARLVRQRLEAMARPWSAGVVTTRDVFSDSREPWLETAVSLGRETPVGAAIVRGSRADRFGLQDTQFEVEFYPRFRAGTSAAIGIGHGSDAVLYPKDRISIELYQSLRHGFEISAGYRRLRFSAKTDIYVGTLSKYAGQWMVTAKVAVVPNQVGHSSWTYQGQARRYFGAAGTSFAGVVYRRGFSREEPRGIGDLTRVDTDTLESHVQIDFAPWARFTAGVSTGWQTVGTRDSVRQTSMASGLTFRF